MAVRVRLDVDPQEFVRFHLEPRFLEELPAQRIERVLRLVDEAARDVPVALPGVVRAAREQHAPVALEDALHAREGVAPVPTVTLIARQMIALKREISGASGAELPVVEYTHEEDMMENLEPTETEQELANTERQVEEEDMRGITNPEEDEDNLPSEDN